MRGSEKAKVWLKEHQPIIGNAAQILAVVLSLVALRFSCTSANNSTVTTATARARDQKDLLAAAKLALRPNSALWSWSVLRSWASRKRAALQHLNEVGPVPRAATLSTEYLVEAERLGLAWAEELGEPKPAAFEFCKEAQRQLELVATALQEGRLDPKTLETQLGLELREFADDVAPRCALALASSAGDRVVFAAGYFLPVPDREFSEDPYLAVPAFELAGTLPRFSLRRHPDQRPQLAALRLPREEFSGCNGLITDWRSEAAEHLDSRSA